MRTIERLITALFCWPKASVRMMPRGTPGGCVQDQSVLVLYSIRWIPEVKRFRKCHEFQFHPETTHA